MDHLLKEEISDSHADFKQNCAFLGSCSALIFGSRVYSSAHNLLTRFSHYVQSVLQELFRHPGRIAFSTFDSRHLISAWFNFIFRNVFIILQFCWTVISSFFSFLLLISRNFSFVLPISYLQMRILQLSATIYLIKLICFYIVLTITFVLDIINISLLLP